MILNTCESYINLPMGKWTFLQDIVHLFRFNQLDSKLDILTRDVLIT